MSSIECFCGLPEDSRQICDAGVEKMLEDLYHTIDDRGVDIRMEIAPGMTGEIRVGGMINHVYVRDITISAFAKDVDESRAEIIRQATVAAIEELKVATKELSNMITFDDWCDHGIFAQIWKADGRDLADKRVTHGQEDVDVITATAQAIQVLKSI